MADNTQHSDKKESATQSGGNSNAKSGGAGMEATPADSGTKGNIAGSVCSANTKEDERWFWLY